jgi:hypothetical protein
MSNELEVRGNSQIATRNAYKFEDLEKMAEVLSKSKMFGAWDTKDKVLALLLISQTEGGNPCTCVQRYFPITNQQGQTSTGKWAKAMLIDFQSIGGECEWLQTDRTIAKATFTLGTRKPFTFSYTWEQAARAKLTNKSNWMNHPEDMLRNTVIAKGLRAYHPASTSFMCSESEGIETFSETVVEGEGKDVTKQGEAEKKELFGNAPKKSAGRPKKEEKIVEVTVVEDEKKEVVTETSKIEPVTTIVEPIQPCIAPAISEPKEEVKDATMKKSEPVKELTEFDKCIKELIDAKLGDKLKAYLYSIKYIAPNASFDSMTEVRKAHLVKNFKAFKSKVENYVAFGTEEK